MLNIFETQQKLAAAFGPSGQENEVAGMIAEIAKPFADEVYTDRLGNLVAYKKGGGEASVMFSAHMDSIGLIVTHIDENGFLWFSQVGGLAVWRIYGSVVRFGNGTRGVVFINGKANPKEAKLSDLYIDIGAPDGKTARETVSVGDVAVFDQPAFLMSGNCLASPYLDDRIACVVLLAAMQEIPKTANDLYFVFSSQEELGLRGAKTAAYGIAPTYGIAVDVTTSGDIPDHKPKMECRLHGGAAVKIMDASVICHPRVVKWLEDAADREGIPRQREILQAGGTDAGAIQVARAGVYAGAISIPTRYIHNPVEICALDDVEACVKLVRASCAISL
ncbi:MAG: M42 family metallopeptidase [Oscillospiraceae bacterium]|jgi:endoglucanase|nr:M42 family metallopeptidase [Oscillospiraceae bacterium]